MNKLYDEMRKNVLMGYSAGLTSTLNTLEQHEKHPRLTEQRNIKTGLLNERMLTEKKLKAQPSCNSPRSTLTFIELKITSIKKKVLNSTVLVQFGWKFHHTMLLFLPPHTFRSCSVTTVLRPCYFWNRNSPESGRGFFPVAEHQITEMNWWWFILALSVNISGHQTLKVKMVFSHNMCLVLFCSKNKTTAYT